MSVMVTLAAALGSCAESPTGPDFGSPAAINIVSGGLQVGALGTDLEHPLVVRVLDERGRSVPAVQIVWTSVSGGAVVAPSTSFTDSTGTASTNVRLGESVGEQRIRASHGTVSPAEFILEGRRHPATLVEVVSGNNQEAQVNATLPQPIVARILDARMDPVPGIVVTFQPSAGTANPTADTSDAAGLVSTTWTLGPTETITAMAIRATDGQHITYGAVTAFAVGLPVAALEIVSGEAQSGLVNSNLPAAITLRVLAEGGTPVVGRAVWVWPSGGGSADPSLVFTGVDGEASTRWRLGTTAGLQRLRFQVDSDSIVVTAMALPAAPASFQLQSGGEQSGQRGTALPEPIVVSVVDAYDNPVPGVAVTFTAQAGSGSFSPAAAATDTAGRASAIWTIGDALGPMTGSIGFAAGPTLAVSAEGTPSLQLLNHRVVDAEFHEGTSRLVTISASPSALHIVNPATAATTTIALPAPPTAIGISPDGSRAAVGHDGFVTIVDLDAESVVQTWPVGTEVLDVIFAGNGYAYVLPRRDQWVTMRSLEVATGTVTASGQFYAGALGRLHPSGEYFYITDNYISPADIEKFDIRGGVAVQMYDSPYHGDHPMGGNVWYSASGDRIYTGRGTIFTSSTAPLSDIGYLTSLAGTFNATWVSHSDVSERVGALARSHSWTTPPVTTLRIYSDAFLNYLGEFPLPRFPRADAASVDADGLLTFFSADGQTLYVLLRAPDSAGVLLNSALTSYALNELPAP